MATVKYNQNELKNNNNKKEENKEVKEEKLSKGVIKIENYLQGELELIIPAYKKITADKVFPIEIEDIEVSSIENFFLCSGATLKCNQGDNSSNYTVLPVNKVFLNDKPLAVVSDIKPMVNIKPFGMCKSMANPTVAAATAANRGQLQKMPCIPSTVGIWSEGINHFLAGDKVPCDKSKCNCVYAGEISITNVGNSLIGTSSGSSSSEEKEKKKKEEEKNEDFKEVGLIKLLKGKSHKND